jgi:glycosyltransferase involved in cell wall biosynthesis
MHPFFASAAEGPLVEHLRARGIHCRVLAAPLYGEGYSAGQRYFEGFFERVSQLKEIIRDNRIELVHTHTHLPFEGAVAALESGVPHVFHVHNNLPHCDRAVALNWLRLADRLVPEVYGILGTRIVAVSEAVAQYFESVRPQVDVVRNGIDLAKFDALKASRSVDLRSELRLGHEAVLVCVVARVERSKNIELFLRAAGRIGEQADSSHFLVVGPDSSTEYTSSLKDLAHGLGLAKRAHFLGARDDVAALLGQSDVCVISSDHEGFPTVGLEAMAAGIPIVATRCGGTEEQVEQGSTGFLVDKGDESGLADRLLVLVKDPEMRVTMGRLARRRAEAEFSSAGYAQAMLRVYDTAQTQAREGAQHSRELAAAAFFSLLRSHFDVLQRLRAVENASGQVQDLVAKLDKLLVYRGAKWFYRKLRRGS